VVWAVAGAARAALSAQGRRSACQRAHQCANTEFGRAILCSNTCSELLRVAILPFYCWISNAVLELSPLSRSSGPHLRTCGALALESQRQPSSQQPELIYTVFSVYIDSG
jgi:hypothetical protein